MLTVEESINITFCEVNSRSVVDETDKVISTVQVTEAKSKDEANTDVHANHESESNANSEANLEELPEEWRVHKTHPQENLLTNPSEKLVTISGPQKRLEIWHLSLKLNQRNLRMQMMIKIG